MTCAMFDTLPNTSAAPCKTPTPTVHPICTQASVPASPPPRYDVERYVYDVLRGLRCAPWLPSYLLARRRMGEWVGSTWRLEPVLDGFHPLPDYFTARDFYRWAVWERGACRCATAACVPRVRCSGPRSTLMQPLLLPMLCACAHNSIPPTPTPQRRLGRQLRGHRVPPHAGGPMGGVEQSVAEAAAYTAVRQAAH